MILNCLFDLDGTLIDSLPGIEYACEQAVREVLPGRQTPDLSQRIGPPIGEILRECLPDMHPEVLAELVQRFRIRYDAEGWRRSVAYKGAAATLQSLTECGQRCFVITNKPLLPTERILRHLGLLGYFEEVVCPDSRMPPFASKAESVAYLLDRRRLDAEKTLLIGDSEDDARAARTCGLQFAAVAYGYGKVYRQREWASGFVLPELSRLAEFVAIGRAANGEGHLKPTMVGNSELGAHGGDGHD